MSKLAGLLLVCCWLYTFSFCAAKEVEGKMSPKKAILFVMTNHNVLGTSGKPTGNCLPEFAHTYNYLIEMDYAIVFASPKGGKTPIDPGSMEAFKDDAECNAFLANSAAMKAISETVTLDNLKWQDYAAIFFPGGNGPMYDLADNVKSQELVRQLYENGRIVAGVCHGVCGLVNVKLSNGEYLVKGRNITGFSNAEEEAVQLTQQMPFLLESQIKANGGLYSKAAENWRPKVVVDGRIVTGQNPASSSPLAEALHKVLSSK